MATRNNNFIIALDFDGTVVTHKYPKIGRDVGAVPVLKRLTDAGHKIVLWTMRDCQELEDAVNWFKDRNIPLFGINETPGQTLQTNKAYAHLYIDDRALGCPLKIDGETGGAYADWDKLEKMLEIIGLI